MSRVGGDRSKIRRPTLFESFVGSAIGIPNHLSKQIGNECSKLADGERFLSSRDSNDQLLHGNGNGHSTRVCGATSLNLQWLENQWRHETDATSSDFF
jgi:hypothetical protein